MVPISTFLHCQQPEKKQFEMSWDVYKNLGICQFIEWVQSDKRASTKKSLIDKNKIRNVFSFLRFH